MFYEHILIRIFYFFWVFKNFQHFEVQNKSRQLWPRKVALKNPSTKNHMYRKKKWQMSLEEVSGKDVFFLVSSIIIKRAKTINKSFPDHNSYEMKNGFVKSLRL